MSRTLEAIKDRHTVEWCRDLANRHELLAGDSVTDDELISLTWDAMDAETNDEIEVLVHRIQQLVLRHRVDPERYRVLAETMQDLYAGDIRSAGEISRLLRDPAVAQEAARENPEWVSYLEQRPYAPMVAKWYASRGDHTAADEDDEVPIDFDFVEHVEAAAEGDERRSGGPAPWAVLRGDDRYSPDSEPAPTAPLSTRPPDRRPLGVYKGEDMLDMDGALRAAAMAYRSA